MDTAGLVHIQATHGHGEGIVESRVPFDSYYMSGGHLVSSTIAHKPVRLRKGEGSGLDIVTNSETLAEKPALSPKALTAMQRTAEEIQGAFGGKEMDIEGIVIGDQVYIVQARPLVAKKTDETFLY